jgi:DNA-binding MarR family transcriptional regulator
MSGCWTRKVFQSRLKLMKPPSPTEDSSGELPSSPSGAVLEWVERLAKYCSDQDGVPLIAGRVLGWLMICDPPEQSAQQIASAIGASRASLSTNLRLLSSVGFVRVLTKPANRTVYYRVDDDAWEKVVQRQIASLAALGTILRDGTPLAGPSPDSGARMAAANEVFRWMQQIFDDAPPLPSTTRAAKEPRG